MENKRWGQWGLFEVLVIILLIAIADKLDALPHIKNDVAPIIIGLGAAIAYHFTDIAFVVLWLGGFIGAFFVLAWLGSKIPPGGPAFWTRIPRRAKVLGMAFAVVVVLSFLVVVRQ
jgi:hypothetical protein